MAAITIVQNGQRTRNEQKKKTKVFFSYFISFNIMKKAITSRNEIRKKKRSRVLQHTFIYVIILIIMIYKYALPLYKTYYESNN